MFVDYLVVGALTRDQTAAGWVRGGTGWYAAHAVAGWGGRVALATPLGVYDLLEQAPGAVLRLPAATTATFRNSYTGDARTQHLLASTAPFQWAALPPAWRAAAIVHLAPLLDELYVYQPRRIFPQALLGLTPQGWSRRWRYDGMIHTQPIELAPELVQQLDVIVVSNEDLPAYTQHAYEWSRLGPVVAVTQGAAGVSIWQRGQKQHVAAFPAQVVDPTGAGDVWAAAFLWRLAAARDVLQAARWACAAAACAIEGSGITTLPNQVCIEQRMKGA